MRVNCDERDLKSYLRLSAPRLHIDFNILTSVPHHTQLPARQRPRRHSGRPMTCDRRATTPSFAFTSHVVATLSYLRPHPQRPTRATPGLSPGRQQRNSTKIRLCEISRSPAASPLHIKQARRRPSSPWTLRSRTTASRATQTTSRQLSPFAIFPSHPAGIVCGANKLLYVFDT